MSPVTPSHALPPDTPSTQKRAGPRPLPLHIANAYTLWMSGAASLPLFMMDGLQTHPNRKKEAAALRHELNNHKIEDLQHAVIQKGQQRFQDFLNGVDAYRHSPYRRQVASPPVFAKYGTTRLLDYGVGDYGGGTNPQQGATIASQPPVIFVPSLINPAYILDLHEQHSMMRYFAASGIRPLLLDWGAPGVVEKQFGLREYVTDRLVPLIRDVAERCGQPVILVGYCMGGTLSVAATQILRAENVISAIALLATPWDFHADRSPQSWQFLEMIKTTHDAWQQIGYMPMDLLQLFFISLDPTLSDRKFRRFGRMQPDDKKAVHFVAIEDWVNDGHPLPLKVADDCLRDWYMDNKPLGNQWQIGTHNINAASIDIPSLVVIPQRDRIVPHDSAMALAKQLPHCHTIEIAAGHVTMVSGERAKEILWQPLKQWMMDYFNKKSE